MSSKQRTVSFQPGHCASPCAVLFRYPKQVKSLAQPAISSSCTTSFHTAKPTHKKQNPKRPRSLGVPPPLLAETEGCQIARKRFTGKAPKKHLSATHTSTHIQKDPFFRCLGRSDSRFQPARTRFESQFNIAHGSMTAISHPEKSFTLRVASAAPLERAQAAIMASNWLIGLPRFLRVTAILAYPSAASWSNPRSRPAKSSAKIASTAADNALLRVPSGRKSKTVEDVGTDYCRREKRRARLCS